jgi:predicted transcriptional regulator
MQSISQPGAMQRKPILMPANLIEKVERIAKDNNVSFAEAVRNIIDVFDADVSTEDEELLEALADEIIRSTAELIAKIDNTIKRIDETHAMIMEHKG